MKILVANKFYDGDRCCWNIFHKGDSFVKEGEPFFIPEFTDNVSVSLIFAVKIKRLGKFIDRKFSSRYYDQATFGLSFVAEDLKEQLSALGENTSLAQNFEKSCVFAKWHDVGYFDELKLFRNSDIVGNFIYDTSLYSIIDEIIETASRYYTIKIGDIICSGVGYDDIGRVVIGDILRMEFGDSEILTLKIK